MKSACLLLLALVLAGCATTARMNALNLGMTKQEVISVMGSPKDSRAKEENEFLIYNLNTSGEAYACTGLGILTVGVLPAMSSDCTDGHDYFVKLTKGKVVSYGKLGDFGSTKTPELKVR